MVAAKGQKNEGPDKTNGQNKKTSKQGKSDGHTCSYIVCFTFQFLFCLIFIWWQLKDCLPLVAASLRHQRSKQQQKLKSGKLLATCEWMDRRFPALSFTFLHFCHLLSAQLDSFCFPPQPYCLHDWVLFASLPGPYCLNDWILFESHPDLIACMIGSPLLPTPTLQSALLNPLCFPPRPYSLHDWILFAFLPDLIVCMIGSPLLPSPTSLRSLLFISFIL